MPGVPVLPIVNSLIMDSATGFLPQHASDAQRQIDYGLVIGIFFLAWFIGVVYVAKLADSIGRRNALLICLGGALAGHAITIVSLAVNSLWLLIVGRAITGFTAGNQPIAQAAMIDGSTDDADRDRNMGYIVTGVSFGLVGGPLIGGVLSDKALVGHDASLGLPFYAALALVSVASRLAQPGPGVGQHPPKGEPEAASPARFSSRRLRSLAERQAPRH